MQCPSPGFRCLDGGQSSIVADGVGCDGNLSSCERNYPKGPSSPYLWFLIPKKALKSYNREYFGPSGSALRL